MPTYLCHGFRWHRVSIRYFVVIQNVDDAASEWIIARHTPLALLNQFYELFDFLPPCRRPTRNLSPSPHHIRNEFPTTNGYAHLTPRSHSRSQTQREDGVARFGNGENGIGNRLNKLHNGYQASAELPAAKRLDKLSLFPPSEPTEAGDEISFNDWSIVKFLEEFDPSDLTTASGQWAYVADYVVRIDTSVSITEEINRYEAQMKTELYMPMSGVSEETSHKANTFGNKRAGWFERLRDQLQRKESIRWYVVVCGDEERASIEPAENRDAKGGRTKSNAGESQSSRGFVEDEFEIRFPDLLLPRRFAEQGLRRRRVERKMAKQSQTSSPNNDHPVIPPPPAPIQVAHKMSMGHDSRHAISIFTDRLRNLLLRRKSEGLT
ncbi:uncharacterized protein F4812DRAFT_260766 [Daldinia caldariorum]|uniref:uncharacterized protein n=1 Tax=Daldinia caldariorum TaxID=326644 RepID=UPI002008982D|nr:uncharacterized protein F4812DRAFT_260766 [Daldinia caldariorum]KAI1470321.1 hypothetical protein F4812DRAFT_260766 [Daldinia caldariorum]